VPTTTTVTKTAGQTLLAWQDAAAGAVAVGPPLDASTKLAATAFARLGRRSGSAFSSGWPNVRVEGSAKAAGNDAWFPLAVFQPAAGASIANTTLSGAVAAGATSCVVASATNIAAGDLLFLKGDADAGNELVRVRAVSGTTVTFEEACTHPHASGNAVTDQADVYVAQLDLTAVTRVRAVLDNAGSGQAVAAEVLCVTGDALSAT
jgi:hypothetical protein